MAHIEPCVKCRIKKERKIKEKMEQGRKAGRGGGGGGGSKSEKEIGGDKTKIKNIYIWGIRPKEEKQEEREGRKQAEKNKRGEKKREIFPAFRRSEKKILSTHHKLHVGINILDFHQTP